MRAPAHIRRLASYASTSTCVVASSEAGAKLLETMESTCKHSDRIRNFCIIAHVDHGKSTLADRLLETTGNISVDLEAEQILDSLPVEKERGITVKSQSCSMVHEVDGETYVLNLIDTPGHVDFAFEVTRSLRACQGALLLVDAAQGVQAQTLANYRAALRMGLTIIPVLTKLDLDHADPDAAAEQLEAACGFDIDELLLTSAKTGDGMEDVLDAVVSLVPPPPRKRYLEAKRALLFDATFDQYRGVVGLIQVLEGTIAAGDKLQLLGSRTKFDVQEVGVHLPTPCAMPSLPVGSVGYVVTGLRDPAAAASIGDTVCSQGIDPKQAEASGAASEAARELLENTAKPMVFASIYTLDAGDYDELRSAVERLTLNDPSVSVHPCMSQSLGMGFRCGFLGLLHMDVFQQRLVDEEAIAVILTSPSIPYVAALRPNSAWSNEHLRKASPAMNMLAGSDDDAENFERIDAELQHVMIETPTDMPPVGEVTRYFEPTAIVSVVAPASYMGSMMKLLEACGGRQQDVIYLTTEATGNAGKNASNAAKENEARGRIALRYLLPWREVVAGLHDDVKAASAGYASMDYEEGPLRETKLSCVEILVNGKSLDALAFLCTKEDAQSTGRSAVAAVSSCSVYYGLAEEYNITRGTDLTALARSLPLTTPHTHTHTHTLSLSLSNLQLKKTIKRQQMEVVIQAAVGSKIVARERITPFRKNVTAKIVQNDQSRKKKLLEKQKRGKARMRTVGNVAIPQEAFLAVAQSGRRSR